MNPYSGLVMHTLVEERMRELREQAEAEHLAKLARAGCPGWVQRTLSHLYSALTIKRQHVEVEPDPCAKPALTLR